MNSGNSLVVVQWLGLSTFAGVAWVQSLDGEPRACKLSSAVQKKNNQKTELTLKKKNELSQLLVMGRISLTLRQERRLALNTDSLQLASS